MKYIIKNKPIHIGKFVWKKNSKYAPNGELYLDYCVSTGYSLVYFTVKASTNLKGEYFFFQYAKDENTEEARYIGSPEDFEVVRLEYMDIESLTMFGYHYPGIKAIIIPNFGISRFYYYIPGEFIFDGEDLLGAFNKNEELLLDNLYDVTPDF